MGDTTVADLYVAGIERHLALAAELTEADGATPTPACPGWTVVDVYAHLAGAAADVVEGRVEGAGSDEWTGRQVAERRGRPLADVVAEYAERGPQLAEALRAFPIERLVIDQWSHEQDVRGAVGRPGSRDVPAVGWAVRFAMEGLGRSWVKRGRTPVRIDTTSGSFVLGDGGPAATFATDDFELTRGLLGRRSPAQLRAMAAPGSDPAAVDDAVAALPFFGPRATDLVE